MQENEDEMSRHILENPPNYQSEHMSMSEGLVRSTCYLIEKMGVGLLNTIELRQAA